MRVATCTLGPSLLLGGWPPGPGEPPFSPSGSGAPARPSPLLPTSSRFKQLLLTQADKFSLAEVKIPAPLTPLQAPSQGPHPAGPWGGLGDPLPSWA